MESQMETLPISPLQEGIWLFWRLNPTSPSYSMPEVLHFDGDFDMAAAEFTFNELIRRHEALRTTFQETDSGVMQVIDHDPKPAPINVVDLRELPADSQSERLASALHAAANLPFNLSAEPAIRLTIIRLSDVRTTLVLVASHIVCDGISMAVLLDEFGKLYRSARQGTQPDLGPESPAYSTFVKGQLAALTDGVLKEEAAFWRDRLAGVTGSALPAAGRGATGSHEALDTFMLSTYVHDQMAEVLAEHARRTRSTRFSILLCAMQIMVATATGDDDVSLGTATSGRSPEFARTVGMLANMVVARSRIDTSKTFAETLEEVSLDLMDAIDHQGLPFSRVVGELHDAGLKPGTEVVRTTFSAGAGGTLNLGEGIMSEVAARTVEGPFDLVVSCDFEPSGGVALDWEFSLRAYPHDLANEYCAAYHEILALLLRHPDAAIDSLGLAEVLARATGAAQSGGSSSGAPSPAAEPEQPTDGQLTSVEEAVAAVWSEVIGTPVDAPEDDFFDLGGHSILAMEAVALLRKRVSPTASVRLLFNHPQLRDFSSLLDVGADADRS